VAAEIREILDRAIERTGAPEELLPLLVSATVGGSEIFPLLLHWQMLRLSVAPEMQEELYADLLKNSGGKRGFGPKFLKCVSACAKDCPASAAIGPPRKLVETLVVNNVEYPAEAIVFAMHPRLCKDRVSPGDPLKLESLGSWPIFGAGPRSCTASELALNFLGALLADIVREYRIVPDESTLSFEFREDGSLLVPANDVKLQFVPRS